MPLSQNDNQCEKLFQHLNYCLSILRKTLDHQKLEILKRVQHDIQLLQKYIKSIMKYNDKRENEIQKLVKQLKRKDYQIQGQTSKILQLSCLITRKDQEISRQELIIEHLKYSRKIDASYVSSILINQNNASSLQRQIARWEKKQNNGFENNSADGLNLSEYSEHSPEQKIAIQETMTTTKSEVKSRACKRADFVCGVINEEQENQEEKGFGELGQNRELHKASSLIFAD